MKNKIFIAIAILFTGVFTFPNITSATAPRIQAINFGAESLEAAESIDVTAVLDTKDTIGLEFIWKAVLGSIKGSGPKIIYTAPSAYPRGGDEGGIGVDTVTLSIREIATGNVRTFSEVIYIKKETNPAKMFLIPEKNDLRLNEINEVAVKIDTVGKSTRGADIVLKYDSNVLEITEIIPGSLFEKTIRNEIKPGETSNRGLILFSQTSELRAFSGEGTLAILKIKPKKIGVRTKMQFDFLKYALSDTNLLKNSKQKLDLLGEVKTGEYLIVPGSIAPVSVKAPIKTTSIKTKSVTPKKISKPLSFNKVPRTPESGPAENILLTVIIFLTLVTGKNLLTKNSKS